MLVFEITIRKVVSCNKVKGMFACWKCENGGGRKSSDSLLHIMSEKCSAKYSNWLFDIK